MRLLFDHNLSPRLVSWLGDLFPNSEHVYNLGLDLSSDVDVWSYAASHAFVIVSKDSDFNDLSLLRGFPPKVIWIRTGNCTSRAIEALIRSHHVAIVEFDADTTTGVLALS